MKQVVVVRAGKIGSTIADMLTVSGDYQVTVVDQSTSQLAAIELSTSVETVAADVRDRAALGKVLSGKFAVMSAAPYHLTVDIA